MEYQQTSPQKRLRSHNLDKSFNNKTSIICSQVPEGLFETKVAEKHFSKFGRVLRIRLMPKKHVCIVEYDQQNSAERALLNAGAFDGFMFDVTRTKPRVRRKSKKDEDPDWVPDPEVKAELSAMSGGPTYRTPRQKPMDLDITKRRSLEMKTPIKKKAIRTISERTNPPVIVQSKSGIESPVLVTTVPTSLTTIEAAAELHKLRYRVSVTPDEKWRTLDARDRVLRGWGGAGSRVKVGGATIGTCPDMCPEKELLHRQAEHQVMTLETVIDSDGLLEPRRAVKQYSRSSADQEIPMCYELRPASVLMNTCAYLLHEIADTTRQVTLADWFHFMWDRFRGIRKDITQQALCCAESICLVEYCARFHAHCSARLADLEHTQFDQKLNTDNLTKCLQTLKHMYADVSIAEKPKEAEFRGYIALLNLGDANFWWEIKQLPLEIQKSASIIFAIQIYTTLDNNNYVKFFRLIREKATYLQACILLRYFNDVRARALARIVKAYAPRGGSLYPAEDLINTLAFETVECMKSFVNHYGLRFSKNDNELSVILNRNQFIEDSEPYPLSRSVKLIESKRQSTVGEVVSGGRLPPFDYPNYNLYSSFDTDGKLKEKALLAEDLGYNTINDSNKDLRALKFELQNLLQGGKFFDTTEKLPQSTKSNIQPDMGQRKDFKANIFTRIANERTQKNLFSFKPAIPIAPVEDIINPPENLVEHSPKNIFTFSKPEKTDSNIFAKDVMKNLFSTVNDTLIDPDLVSAKQNVCSNTASSNSFNTQKDSITTKGPSSLFKSAIVGKSIFNQQTNNVQVTNTGNSGRNNFVISGTSLFSQGDSVNSAFTKMQNNVFSKLPDNVKKTDNVFAIPQNPNNIFGSIQKPSTYSEKQSIFKSGNINDEILHSNGGTKTSPGSLFKSAIQPSFENTKYPIFQSKNKTQTVADSIINSVPTSKNNLYDFDNKDNSSSMLSSVGREFQEEEKRCQDENEKVKREKEELKRINEIKAKQEAVQLEDLRRKEALRLEELRKIEEKRRTDEERKQEELRKKLEDERIMELKRKAEEEEKLFKEKVEKESMELTNHLICEINEETVKNILNDEIERLKKLLSYAAEISNNIYTELTTDMCHSEMKAELFRTKKLTKKWYYIWRKQFVRNFKRRSLLEDTPVWLPDVSPQKEARFLRRVTEDASLQNMSAFHRGYKFTGELKLISPPKSYKILDLIRSPLLKRMKQIEYPYDKCFFWKVAIVLTGSNKWLYKKINMEQWIQHALGDNKTHDTSESLIYVGKESWNNLIDFAVSISLIKQENFCCANEALNGANGIIFYATGSDNNYLETIDQLLNYKYPYQVIPITIVMSNFNEASHQHRLNDKLTYLKNENKISDYKICIVDKFNVEDSVYNSTKSALKWLAKNYPKPPGLEINFLKSICLRYLGNELWQKLRSERDNRMESFLKSLQALVTCYNVAVDKITQILTNEDLFNYPTFPLEFTQYLDNISPYPRPYEFITSNVKQSDNINAIRNRMQMLKLPSPYIVFHPRSVKHMQEQIRRYCNQIGWFANPDEVVCKVITVLPNEFSDVGIPHDRFSQYFDHYDLIDFLNVIVYEKIKSLDSFGNILAVYEKAVLEQYSRMDWLFEIELYSKVKNKILEYEDDLDLYIQAKRRKLNSDSEFLMIEENDSTLVEENIQMIDKSITTYNTCKDTVTKLEEQLDEKMKKSKELENLLRAALHNV